MEGKRDSSEGRGAFDCLTYAPMMRIAKHLEAGAKRYGLDNWRAGISIRRCFQALLRHALQALEGHTDEDHLAAVAVNAMFIMQYEEDLANGTIGEKFNDTYVKRNLSRTLRYTKVHTNLNAEGTAVESDTTEETSSAQWTAWCSPSVRE